MIGTNNEKKKADRYRASIMVPKENVEIGKGVVLLEDNVTYAGMLYKYNRSGEMGINPWRLRYFLINTEDGSLKYYTSKKSYRKGQVHRDRMSIIEMYDAGRGRVDNRYNRLRFDVAVKGETDDDVNWFTLKAKSYEQYVLWSDVLLRAANSNLKRIHLECKACKKTEPVDVHPTIDHMLLQYLIMT